MEIKADGIWRGVAHHLLQGAETQIGELKLKLIFSMLDWMNKSVLPHLAFYFWAIKRKKDSLFRILKRSS